MRVVLPALLAVGCGRLDFGPTSPQNLSYDTKAGILLFNDVAPDKTRPVHLEPRLIGLATTFTVEPDLPALTGLAFDVETGVISGEPSRISPVTRYTVTAGGDLGSTDVQLVLRTHPGFYVESQEDGGDADLLDNDCTNAAGACTLRAAIEQLNAFDPISRIALLPVGKIKVGSELSVTNPIEIIGDGRDTTILDGEHTSRILQLGIDNTATISDLTTQNGSLVGSGACIGSLGGTITLARIAVIGCTSTGDIIGAGGVMLADDFGQRLNTVIITDSVFRDNSSTATTTAFGGALNIGCGFAGSHARVENSTFENNTVAGPESAGSALNFGAGPIDLVGNLFVGNTGRGAMFFQDGSIATLVNNTITGNTGPDSAGIQTNNTTVLTLINNTIAGNRCASACFLGTGIRQNTGGMLFLENNIIADNLEGTTESNCTGPGASSGHNLTDSPASHSCFGGGGPGDLFGADPLLEPLSDNGGPTRTRAITTQSGAFNGGGAACPSLDQRGQTRPANGACDIGAFELQ